MYVYTYVCTIADKSFFLLRVISPRSYCPLSGRQVDGGGTTILSFCLSLSLTLCLSVCLSVCMSVSLIASLILIGAFSLFVCLSVFLPLSLSLSSMFSI